MKRGVFVFLFASFRIFAIDSESFVLYESNLTEYDKYQISHNECSDTFRVFETQGVLLSHLKNYREYGYLVSQIKIFDVETKTVLAIHSNDVEMSGTNLNAKMRGDELSYSNITCSETKVSMDILSTGQIVGKLKLMPRTKKLNYVQSQL